MIDLLRVDRSRESILPPMLHSIVKVDRDDRPSR
jgi:hypothetical protein